MKLFRIRFIVLGLLLCVVHVWCRTCGTEFTDPGSSSYLAEVVVEGRVSAIKQTNIQGRFNITISIRKVRKGTDLLLRGRKTKRLTIGEFGSENLDECVTNIKRTKNKYFFFLKSTDSKHFFKISSFPVIATKQSGRLVRKGACKTCGKEPVLRKIKVKNFKVGKRLQLRCRLRSGKPDPKFHWTKDGVLLPEKRKGLQIKSKRRWSQIKIKKATKEDEGVYKCFATNVVGSTYQVARVKVLPIPPRRPTVKTTTASQDRYLPCKKEDQGYCLNGGTCRIIKDLDFKSCACSASYEGVRCQFRAIPRRNLETDSRENSGQDQQRDRTLTIIGIVIGILIFVCFCIASYFIAKKRRTAYLKKKALQRKHANGQLYSSPNHSPYHAMSPRIVTDPTPEKARLFLRQDTINMETQTEDFLNFISPYPNTNHNRPTIHLNPLDNIVLRNPPPKRNSRSRLSGISTTNDRPTSQPEVESPKNLVLKNSSDHERPSGILGDQGIPRLRVSSDSVSDSENRDEDMASLHISEDDHDTSSRNPHIYPNQTNKVLSKNSSFDSKLSQNSSHIDFSDTDEEVQKLQNGSFGEQLIGKCSDTLSWNERGSPEQLGHGLCFDIEDPRYIKSKPYEDDKNVLDICKYNSPYNGSDIRENEPSIPV